MRRCSSTPVTDMAKQSAGLVVFRRCNSELQVFLVHPGGPFWKNKDEGAWSIPKGECHEGEDGLDAAKREFQEETGCKVDGEFVALGEIKQAGGKVVAAWALEGDCAPTEVHSNTFSMEWPPKSGQKKEFPEIDRAEWFILEEARKRMLKGQIPFLDRLVERLQ